MSPLKRYLALSFLLVFFGGGLATVADKPSADLVLLNGKIATVDPANRIVQALAVKGDKILAIGSDREVRALISPTTKVVDLQGGFAMPGFIDSHGHFLNLGEAKMSLDLSQARSWDEIVRMVKAAVAKARPGEWIGGRGWHQEKWEKPPEPNVGGLPLHQALSLVSPVNPVLLTHASGHSCLANAKAMELAKIDRHTPNPPGGEIIRDSAGEPIGAFLETAEDLIYSALDRQRASRTLAQIQAGTLKALELAEQECLSAGVTTFHDAGVSFATVDFYKKQALANKLRIRLYVMIAETNDQLNKRMNNYRIIGLGNAHLTVRAVKRIIDGALGSHGAWLLEPYTSLPDSTGLNTEPAEVMKETAHLAITNGFQLCTHAIGDRANREILNIYENTFREFPQKTDLRWRVEHAQHLDPADIPRFAQLGVIAAMQGIHCTSDGPWVIKRLGEKRTEAGAYVWRKLLATGAVICNGTDVPVEDVNPIPNFFASVTRRLKDGTRFFPDQCMSREEALRSYTINGAYAAFEEKIKGSLEPGKLADIVVLSGDLLTLPEDDLLKVKVLYTIIGGRVVYQKKP